MNCCAPRVDLVWLIIIIDIVRRSVSATDPCYNHTDLTDNKYTTNNTAPGTNRGFSDNGWYRVTSSKEGLLVQTCPAGNECGTSSQVWMRDTVPTYSSGETTVKTCIRSGNSCCGRTRPVRMKNCNTFVVYYLLRIPPDSGYCFESSSSALQPVSTTRITSSVSSSPQTASSSVQQTTLAKMSTIHQTLSQSTAEIQTSTSTVNASMIFTTPATVRSSTYTILEQSTTLPIHESTSVKARPSTSITTEPLSITEMPTSTAVTTHVSMTRISTREQSISTFITTNRQDNPSTQPCYRDNNTMTDTSKVAIVASVSIIAGVLCIVVAAVIIRMVNRSNRISAWSDDIANIHQQNIEVQFKNSKKAFDRRVLYERDYTFAA